LPQKISPVVIVLSAASLLTALAIGGCGRTQAPAATPQLVVIGIDSADWVPIDSLLAAGKLPHLRGLLAQGTAVNMRSLDPLEKSPVLWACIATGRRPEDHGVGGFVKGDEDVPIRGAAWKAPAIWDVAGAAGLTSTVIGWWVTHPARPIHGVMVSDYLPYAEDLTVPLEGLATPDSLAREIGKLSVDPASISDADLGRFVNLDALAGHEQQFARELAALRSIWAADRSYLAVGRRLARQPSDLFLLYLRGLDMVSHEFWAYWRPPAEGYRVEKQGQAIFGQVVPRYYEFADEMLGEALSWFPPDRQVVVTSDHGFQGPRRAKSGWTHGTGQHRLYGIFVVRSPLYEAGARGGTIGVMDICPTLLSLIGLPPSREMPGAILATGLTREGSHRQRRLEKERVASYQSLRPPPAGEGSPQPVVDEKIRQQLRSLGYIK
jgi:predicted AlkP superfamily phosphohydrolase/phosphomutase